MKLATLRDGTRDGALLLVSRDLRRALRAGGAAPTLWAALEDWERVEPRLRQLHEALEGGRAAGAFDFDPAAAAAPLPRAPQWLDGSAFRNHSELFIQAWRLKMRWDDETPLMYQGASDDFLGPLDDVPLPSEADDIDLEGEIAVVTDEVPMGTSAADASRHIKLLMIANDVSLRAFGPREMATGFGFLQAKPSTSFAPVAVTLDELGEAWQDGRLRLPLHVSVNGKWFGRPDGRHMSFGFPRLVEHAARTRRLTPGTIVGSGTVSDPERGAGSATILERRAIEMIESGAPQTPYLRFGDRVRIELLDAAGQSIAGAIDQRMVQARGTAGLTRASRPAP
jgi:fumarylacetoacetate (FAA) hydrolase